MRKLLLFSVILLLINNNSYPQWTSLSSFPAIYARDLIYSGDTLFAATAGLGVYVSVNAGTNWVQINSGLTTMQALSVNQLLLMGNEIYAATDNGIYKSTNRGANWLKKSTGIVIGGGAIYEFTQSISLIGGKLFTGAYTGIYTSTDGAESWQVTNISGSAVMAKSFTVHSGLIFAARETINTPYAYNSTNNGLTWNEYNTLTFPTITFLSEPPVLWAGTIDGVWLTTNNGASWQVRNNGLSADPYSSSLIRVGGTLVTSLKFGGSGVYRSSNNGLNWENIGQTLPFLTTIDKLIKYHAKLIAVTSQGLWQKDTLQIVTGVEKHIGELPQSYKLFQNYPNPFNPTTNIRFSIPPSKGDRGMTVKLTVFDILGREVTVPVNEQLTPGMYEIGWNASNYPSGVYYYKLESGSYSETKKMILLK